MPSRTVEHERRAPNLPFSLLMALLAILWFAGGASRADVPGQFVVRVAAWIALIVLLFRDPWPQPGPVRAPLMLLIAAISLVALQLVPLPPVLWTALPGRSVLQGTVEVIGLAQPWRPVSVSPEATRNALGSLVVPASVLATLLWFDKRQHRKLLTVLAITISLSSLLALIQFSGARFDNPMINDQLGDIAGSFANRNHMAVFAAVGIALAPAACLEAIEKRQLSLSVAIGLIVLMLIAILATGSRSGLLLGAAGTVLGGLAVRERLVREFHALPRKWSRALVALAFGSIVGTVVLSVVMGRAASIDRAVEASPFEDMRFAIWSTVLEMVVRYFPAGTGFGAFDPAYRINESAADLSTKYINQAHNDVLQTLLDGGLAGALLLILAGAWWARASWQAWRIDNTLFARLGSGILLLVFIASLVDYPARTPMMMAIIAIAFVWLARFRSGPALAS